MLQSDRQKVETPANQALRKSYPFQNGNVLYQQDFGNNKIVIWNTGDLIYAKVVNTTWGMLHQVTNVSVIHPREPNDE
jgi:hypothetical protein